MKKTTISSLRGGKATLPCVREQHAVAGKPQRRIAHGPLMWPSGASKNTMFTSSSVAVAELEVVEENLQPGF